MKLITPRVKSVPASSMVNLDTYTAEDKLIFSKADGDKAYIGRVYKATPLVGGGHEFANVVRNVFKSVPDDSVIQATLLCAPDHGAPERFARNKDQGSATVLELVARQRGVLQSALEVGWQADVPILNDRQVIISLAVPIARSTRPTQEVLEAASQLHAEFLGNLKACGFEDVAALSAAQVVQTYRQFAEIFAPSEPVLLDELVDLKFQVFGPDQVFDFSDRRVGILGGPGRETYCAAVTCKSYPPQVSHGLMNLASGAPLNQGPVREGGGQRIATPFILSTTIRVANQRKEDERVKRAIESRSAAQGLPFKLGTEDSKTKLNDLQLLARQCAEAENKYVYASTTGFVFAKSAEQAVQASSALKGTLDKLEFDGRDVLDNVALRWAQMLPMNFSPALAEKLAGEAVMSAAAAGCLLPVYGDYLGNLARDEQLTGMGLVTRRGALLSFDPFKTQSNPSGVVAAMSGAGKTVLVQSFVLSQLAEGTRVFLLDNGRSIKKFCHAVGGEYNEFGSRSGFRPSLNPFTGLSDDEFDEQQETITALLLQMAYEAEVPDPGARIAMNEAVKAAFGQQQRTTEIEHVIEALKKTYEAAADNAIKTQVVEAAANLVPRLKAFIESPSRGQYFRNKGTLDPRNQLTVFELGTLGDDEHLKKCVLFFIMNLLITRIKTIKGRKLILVDESHDLLKDPMAAAVMEGIYLKGRKDRVAVWVVVQSLLKLANTPAGPVMLNQSPWKLILQQSSEEIDKVLAQGVISAFSEDPYFHKVLRSVQTRKGEYSEVLVLSPTAYEVGRLYLDRFTSTLLSSEGDAREAVFEMMERGVSAADAVNAVLGDTKSKRAQWIREIVTQLRETEGLTSSQILEEIRETLQ